MTKKKRDTSQDPRKCNKCKIIIAQIEPDEESCCRALHWGDKQDHWSLQLLSWPIKSKDYKKPETYILCYKCKEKLIKWIG